MADRKCSVEGCVKPLKHVRLRLCAAHLARLRRYGHPTASPRGTAEQRLWRRVNKDGPIPGYAPHLGPCWLWTGYLHSPEAGGYGRLTVDGREVLAHRYAYELLVGPIPGGLPLDHLCRVTLCVNPAHLEPVTHAVNIHRGFSIQAFNARKTHCIRGHEFTPENTLIRPEGGRRCRICTRRTQAAYKQRQREAAMAA